MATKDWKAELRRRIADIKEKKKAEQSIKDKAKNYLEKQRRAMEFEEALEEGRSAQEEPADVADFPAPEKKESTTAEAEEKKQKRSPAKSSKKAQPVEESLFQLEEEPEKDKADEEAEQRIRDALKRFSNTPPTEEEAAEEKQGKERGKKAAEQPQPAANRRSAAYENRAAEKDNPSEPDVMENLRAAQARVQDSLEMALDSALPEDEIAGSGDTLRHAMTLDDEDDEDPDIAEPSAATSTGTFIDTEGRYIAGLRAGAGLVDLAITALITAGFVWIASMILAQDFVTVVSSAWLPVTGLFAVIHMLYYITFTSSSGQTIGKSIFKLKARGSASGPMGILRALGRWLLNAGSLAVAGLGLLMAFVHPRGYTLPDMLLNQRVARTVDE